jgi:hypothetical protein
MYYAHTKQTDISTGVDTLARRFRSKDGPTPPTDQIENGGAESLRTAVSVPQERALLA